jgi:tetratricopeptide (TPR) repeat protein
MRFTTLLSSAILISLPAVAHSQSDVDFKTTNQRAIDEFNLGVRNAEYNSSDEASNHFAAALRADPGFGLARVFWALFAQLPPVRLEAEITRGIADAAHGTDNELILALAVHEFSLNRPNVGAALFRAASELRPSDRYAGLLAMSGLSGNDALAAHRDFAARHPEYALTYNSLAFDLWFAGDRAGALAAAKKQIEFDSAASNPHDSYAHLSQWNGDFDAAKIHYRTAVKLPSPYVGSYGGLAEVAALQGNYAEARGYLDKAIGASYTSYERLDYMQQVAGTYALQGGHVDALARQLEAIAAAAKSDGRMNVVAEAYGQIAASRAAEGKADVAHKYIETSMRGAPSDAWWQHYYAAVAHAQLKHWTPAANEISALKSMQSRHVKVSADHLAAAEGYLLTQQGKPNEALKALMSADTTSYIVMNRIAEAHAALGHRAEAMAWNKRIADNYNVGLADFPGVNARRRAREEMAIARP